MNNYANTIAAVSTPPGKGGVAIIRISGTDAICIGEKVFHPSSKKSFSSYGPRIQIRGDIYYGNEQIDDGMATYFKAPASYTGEDTVEIYCHGGALVTKTVLEAVLAAGAVHATAGEFTRRAFINGKLSLTDAESIGNLLEAESREQIKLASVKSRSSLTQKIEEIKELLVSVLSSIYARIDYPDEDLGDFTDEEALSILTDTKDKISALISTYQTGKAINEGISTVICGKPNAGKSSLYNLILGQDAAIVTDIEGTTRDVLSEKIPLGRVMLRLFDTAGVRLNTDDPIERIGIEKSRDKIRESELIIAVFDNSREFSEEDKALIECVKSSSGAKIALLNKCDLEAHFDSTVLSSDFDTVLEISTKNSDGVVDKLAHTVNNLFTDEKIILGEDAVIASARQNAELIRALEFTASAIESYENGISQDAVSSDIERALSVIAEIDGKSVSDEVVSDIFKKFCVGK